MFTRDSKILSNKLTTPLTEVSKAIGNVFKRYVEFDVLIKSLFANNEQGFAYDLNDLSTMYQDAAGTVPVTGVGQPVGLILDKSGRDNHAYQSTSASRPILRQNATTGAYYLEFDGVDDYLVTNSIDFTVTDKISLFTGVRNLSDTDQIITELSEHTGLYSGSFFMGTDSDSGVNIYVSILHGTAYINQIQTTSVVSHPAPDDAVLSLKHDISGGLSSIRRNGVVGVDGLGDKGAGNFGNYPLYIGRRGSLPLPLSFNGHIYGLIAVGKLASGNETTVIEKELAERTGVTLSV